MVFGVCRTVKQHYYGSTVIAVLWTENYVSIQLSDHSPVKKVC